MIKLDTTNLLIDELASENVNILTIRKLCRDNPGLIATAGLRIKIWTLLLLGSSNYHDFNKEMKQPAHACLEQHVLEADVHRTRADVEEFRATSWRQQIQTILQSFCLAYNIQYKQGMNEVLAPFIFIHPPPGGALLPYSLFKAFLFRYLERYFCTDDSAYLFKSFRLFHLLLLYFDPQLALHLQDQEFPPELYTPQWFLTLFSRALPLPHVLRLWDMLVAVDDPSFTFFVGLCLLRRRRDALLLADTGRIPEIVVAIQFKGEEEIDSVVVEAMQLYQNTPRCFLRSLRLCCVSTTELTPQPPASSAVTGVSGGAGQQYSVNINELDKTMSVQAARSCFMLSAQDLVNSVAPIITPNRYNPSDEAQSESKSSSGSANSVGGDFSIVPQQYVLIDIRSYEDVVVSGGGAIPRAIQLEPDFLNRPDAFDIWLQHFDGTRGCNICIIDLPPGQWKGIALWRRLLLGDGDGQTSNKFEDREENKRKVNALSHRKDGEGVLHDQERDEESKFAKEEAAAVNADLTRPAVLLALALQRNSFSNVSVLDGGFPALVEQLISSRGTVEPVVINHEPDKWVKFLKSTGREYEGLLKSTSSNNAKKSSVFGSSSAKRASIVSSAEMASLDGSQHSAGSAANAKAEHIPRKVSDLSALEKHQIALRYAEKLCHSHMRAILQKKILEETVELSADDTSLEDKE